MKNRNRFIYQPGLPLGKDGKRVTGGTEHIALSREAAAEGMVLLKNEKQVLPLAKGTKAAVFGKACVDYVKGGGGSGDVTVAYVRSLLDALRKKEAEGKVSIYEPLGTFYEKEVAKQYEAGIVPGMTSEPQIPEELLKGASAFADTAIVTICRFSGENWDRTVGGEPQMCEYMAEEELALLRRASEVFERGDFYLSNAEQKMIEDAKANFKKVIVVMNVGGMVDSTWFAKDDAVNAVLMAWQGGMEGGLATADLLVGDAVPSGKLVDTFAQRLEDYPSSYNFHESQTHVEYTDDIYVGYRYFETIPGAAGKVNYPFGFGLSYTSFLVEVKQAEAAAEGAEALVTVTNTGDYAGKEVVQLYVSAPQGRLGKPAKELKAFAKTRLLQPGEAQTIRLTVTKEQMASYDDLGKIQKSAYVLEKGMYTIWVGTSVRDVTKACEYMKESDEVVIQLTSRCAPNMLAHRMTADGTMEGLPMDESAVRISAWSYEATPPKEPDVRGRKGALLGPVKYEADLEEVAAGTMSLDEFVGKLPTEDLIHLVCGQPNTGIANTYGFGNLPEYNIPNVMTADGPAGLRIRPEVGVKTTAFPCATLLASSWNTPLVERVGEAGAEEVRENNIAVWLTPAMNIHRSPLCGRNFEYYSEDPLIAGKMGAALVRGIQSQHVGASVKHFCCNNKETRRVESDSRVSERALREIYLKGFEIVVKEADPWTIMTSYNIVNGQRSSENKDLLTNILREEWGFDGMVTTDWWNHAEQYLELQAGNDVKMGCGYPERLAKDVEEHRITREEIAVCAKRVLELILKVSE